jgi:hypothetical protein
MTEEGGPAVFVVDEVAAARAVVQGARDAAMDSIYRTDFVKRDRELRLVKASKTQHRSPSCVAS